MTPLAVRPQLTEHQCEALARAIGESVRRDTSAPDDDLLIQSLGAITDALKTAREDRARALREHLERGMP